MNIKWPHFHNEPTFKIEYLTIFYKKMQQCPCWKGATKILKIKFWVIFGPEISHVPLQKCQTATPKRTK